MVVGGSVGWGGGEGGLEVSYKLSTNLKELVKHFSFVP